MNVLQSARNGDISFILYSYELYTHVSDEFTHNILCISEYQRGRQCLNVKYGNSETLRLISIYLYYSLFLTISSMCRLYLKYFILVENKV